jgi:hypothetical protein
VSVYSTQIAAIIGAMAKFDAGTFVKILDRAQKAERIESTFKLIKDLSERSLSYLTELQARTVSVNPDHREPMMQLLRSKPFREVAQQMNAINRKIIATKDAKEIKVTSDLVADDLENDLDKALDDRITALNQIQVNLEDHLLQLQCIDEEIDRILGNKRSVS